MKQHSRSIRTASTQHSNGIQVAQCDARACAMRAPVHGARVARARAAQRAALVRRNSHLTASLCSFICFQTVAQWC
eukprot:1841471-Lingulodinium_polyedra.AAC.1